MEYAVHYNVKGLIGSYREVVMSTSGEIPALKAAVNESLKDTGFTVNQVFYVEQLD